MRINARVVIDIEHDLVLACDSVEYDGPVIFCGGGPSQQQIDAANATASNTAAQTQIAQQQNQRQNQEWSLIQPYIQSRLTNGLPFYNDLTSYAKGNAATAYNPVRAATVRNLASFGSALPSGFKQASLNDVNTNEAQAFDQGLQNAKLENEQAKSNAAGMAAGQQQINNPVSTYAAANQGNNDVMQAPLQSPGLGGLIGGLGGGLLSAVGSAAASGAIPF